MPIFIADHTGKLPGIGGIVHPIHIGAALCDRTCWGPEPDNLASGSVSADQSLADLRLHHYVSRLTDLEQEFVAIMQYRRMYFIGKPRFYHFQNHMLVRSLRKEHSDMKSMPFSDRDTYLKHLKSLTEADLHNFLEGHSAVMTRHSLVKHSVEVDFVQNMPALYSGDTRCVLAWQEMRRLLVNHFGKQIVSGVLDGKMSYYHNTMVTSVREFREYTDILFKIVEELAEFKDLYRIFGYLAERIQTVYVRHRELEDTNYSVLHRRIMYYE